MTTRLMGMVVLVVASPAIAAERRCDSYVMVGAAGDRVGAAALEAELTKVGLRPAPAPSADLRFRLDADSTPEPRGTPPLVSYQGRFCVGASWAIEPHDWGTLVPGDCLVSRERFSSPQAAQSAGRRRWQREHVAVFRAALAAALPPAVKRCREVPPAQVELANRKELVTEPAAREEAVVELDRKQMKTALQPGWPADARIWGAAGVLLLAGVTGAGLLLRWRRTKEGDGSVVVRGVRLPARAFIFLSYSRHDRASAETLYRTLRDRKVAVWWDREELDAGDRWKEEIEIGLSRCALFVPLVSAHALGRSEGFFVSEWREALRRRDTMKNRAFVVPVVIDPQLSDDQIRGDEVARRFLGDAQLVRAPGGRISEADLDQLAGLLAECGR